VVELRRHPGTSRARHRRRHLLCRQERRGGRLRRHKQAVVLEHIPRDWPTRRFRAIGIRPLPPGRCGDSPRPGGQIQTL